MSDNRPCKYARFEDPETSPEPKMSITSRDFANMKQNGGIVIKRLIGLMDSYYHDVQFVYYGNDPMNFKHLSLKTRVNLVCDVLRTVDLSLFLPSLGDSVFDTLRPELIEKFKSCEDEELFWSMLRTGSDCGPFGEMLMKKNFYVVVLNRYYNIFMDSAGARAAHDLFILSKKMPAEIAMQVLLASGKLLLPLFWV